MNWLTNPHFIFAVIVLWLLALLTGCATLQATDTTRALEALTAGEAHVTYTKIPGDLAPGGALAGRDLWVPTVPGKDVSLTAWYPDGSKYVEVTAQRSPVVDVLLARAAGIDAEKFAADANLRAWISAERAAYLELLQPLLATGNSYLQQRAALAMAQGQANLNAPTAEQRLLALYDEIKAREAARMYPTSAPARP